MATVSLLVFANTTSGTTMCLAILHASCMANMQLPALGDTTHNFFEALVQLSTIWPPCLYMAYVWHCLARKICLLLIVHIDPVLFAWMQQHILLVLLLPLRMAKRNPADTPTQCMHCQAVTPMSNEMHTKSVVIYRYEQT